MPSPDTDLSQKPQKPQKPLPSRKEFDRAIRDVRTVLKTVGYEYDRAAISENMEERNENQHRAFMAAGNASHLIHNLMNILGTEGKEGKEGKNA